GVCPDRTTAHESRRALTPKRRSMAWAVERRINVSCLTPGSASHRVEVRGYIKNGFVVHNPFAGLGGYGVALGNCEVAVHFQVNLYPDHVAQFARTQGMDAFNAGG